MKMEVVGSVGRGFASHACLTFAKGIPDSRMMELLDPEVFFILISWTSFQPPTLSNFRPDHISRCDAHLGTKEEGILKTQGQSARCKDLEMRWMT